MGIFDFLIIYLTFGAPFAVFEYLRHQSVPRTFGVFAFWPPTAWKLVAGRITSSRKSPDRVADERTKRVAGKLQRDVAGTAVSVREFRDAIDRYIGLSFEIDRDEVVADTKSAELLRISGRGISRATSATLSRRNAVRLARHHTDARERFLELIERSQEFNAMMHALELATLLDDTVAKQYLNRAIGRGGTEGEVWETQESQTSKERIAA